MGLDPSRAMYRDLGLIGEAGTVAGLTDAELLHRFAGRRGGAAEVAFEALVRRHGPMVLGTCRRALRDPAEADDAFQATFLVLARKAGSVRVGDSLGPWLRGVARRVAGKALARSRRRRRVEVEAGGVAEPSARADPDAGDLGRVLLEELDRLPEKYRSPVVLCHLEGKTHEEAARDLRWPVGTVSGRLSRARDLLRSRLARRGLSPTASAVLAALLAREAGAVPPGLIEATARLATRFAAGQAIPESLRQLTRGVLAAMLAHQIKLGALAASAIAVLTVGVGYVAGQVGGPTPAPAPAPAPQAKPIEIPPPGAQVKPNSPTEFAVAPVEAPPPVFNLPGFPKTSERSRQRLEELRKNRPRRPINSTMQTASMVVATSPDGRTLNAISLSGGRWQAYQVPEGLRSMPFATQDMLAVALAGPEVREVAVFNASGGGGWSRHPLREPFTDEVVPEVSPGVALYQVGNDFHAYSVAARAWDTLHLEAGEAARHEFACNDRSPTGGWAPGGPNAIFVQQGRTLYVFSIPLGKWSEGVEVKPIEAPK